jgi:hypothetical protein
MNDDRLDGNAVAGLLGEVFPFEMTMASTVCATCGALDRVGALLVYERAPGAVVRCAHCENVQMRIASDDGRYWLDLRGVSCLELRI